MGFDSTNKSTHSLSGTCTQEFVTSLPFSETNQYAVKRKEKRQRNVAIASLLEGIERQQVFLASGKENLLSEHPKLLKPADFVIVKDLETNRLHNNNQNVEKDNVLSKGTVQHICSSKEMITPTEESVSKNVRSFIPVSQNTYTYKPSPLVNIYYQKYLGRIYVKQLVQEDLWAKIEDKIREIDEKSEKAKGERKSLLLNEVQNMLMCKRKRNTATSISRSMTLYSAVSNTNSEYKSNNLHDITALGKSCNLNLRVQKGMQAVELPRHRHLLTDFCVVCTVLGKMEHLESNLDGNDDDKPH